MKIPKDIAQGALLTAEAYALYAMGSRNSTFDSLCPQTEGKLKGQLVTGAPFLLHGDKITCTNKPYVKNDRVKF